MADKSLLIKAKTIAVIGAGPSGVIAAKYLRAEKAFEKITLFEQRARSGGIWNYTNDLRDEDLFSIPQTDPRGKNQEPSWTSPIPQASAEHREGSNGVVEKPVIDSNHSAIKVNGTDAVGRQPTFLSPMYKNLETNIPRGLMGFQGLSWPADSQLFPKHETVLQYIADYGADVQDLVRYGTQIVNVEPISSNPHSAWRVTSRNLEKQEESEETYDAVIVANGHFITPYVPDILGIEDWNKRWPGKISHSKYYRDAEEFTGKKVIVVGNSASGADISAQIAAYCSLPLLWSSKSVSLFSGTHATGDGKRKDVPPIKKFLLDERGVEFEDGSIERDIDAIVFATGYFYSLPFLENVRPQLITDGSYVNHTYQHIIYAPQPTLSFLALNQRVIPFPVAEAQSSVLARVYAGRLKVPSLQEMELWEEGVKGEQGDGRNFHLLPFPKDGNYINEMGQWAVSADKRQDLENDGKGKLPPVWGQWEFWCRENFPAIRRKFGELGEKRKHVTTLEEVGFDFEAWRDQKQAVEGKMI